MKINFDQRMLIGFEFQSSYSLYENTMKFTQIVLIFKNPNCTK